MSTLSSKLSGWLGLGALVIAVAAAAPLYAQQNQLSFDQLKSNQADSVELKDEMTIVKKSPFTSVKAETAPAPAPSGFNWKGGYIGGHVGYGMGKADTRFEPLPSAATFINMAPVTIRNRPRGFLGGIQGGYNWQSGNFVFGGEGSLSWSNIKRATVVTPIIQNNGTPFPGAGFQLTSQKTTYFGTLRPRAGVAFSNVLLYGTAGLAFGRVQYVATTDFRPAGTTQYPAAVTKTKSGWTAGGGIEVGFRRGSGGWWWSFKSEYLYYDLGNVTSTVSATPALPPFQIMYTWQTKAHTWNSGVNFHF